MRTAPLLRRQWAGLAIAFPLLAPLHPGVAAQRSDLSLEVGGSSVSPPAGIEGSDARFLVAGIRGLHFTSGGSGVLASFLVGRTLESGSGGDFLSGSLEGEAWRHFGRGWWAGVELKGFGFRVAEPFPYRSLGLEGGPSLRFNSRHLSATVRGVAGSGWSRTELQRTGSRPAEVVEDELWRYGGTGEVLAGAGGVLGGLALGVHESSGGTYSSAGLRMLMGGGGPALELRMDAWRTPSGNETTGGVAFIVPVGGWSVRGFLGRTEPDPLTLAEPGGGSGGILLGRRVLGVDPLPPPRPPLHQVRGYSDGAASVEIRVVAPRGTGRVDVIGDFTLWEPVPMEADGTSWVLRIEIPEGIHHFGFLADGGWFLPEDAPDAVADDWGRKNATMVIER